MTVQCGLCPKACVIAPGQSGDCRIRVNIDDRLTAVTYGYPCSLHVDPVEKKPLFHFLPGTPIFSIATVGCNLHCRNCQNWEISQQNPEDSRAYHVPPEALSQLAIKHQCKAIAYTYTDPAAYYEYALDSCRQAHEHGIKNVLVTAAYINSAPFRKLCKHVDAANIDLKALSDTFYRDICDGTLQPVLDALVLAKSMGVMVEITNLIIPTLNDTDSDLTELCRWIMQNMGKDTPIHFARFFPHYRMRNLPPTPAETLHRARSIAKGEGLRYAYIGNLLQPDAENTYCPACGKLLIQRRRYTILENHVRDGNCPYCGSPIYGVWK